MGAVVSGMQGRAHAIAHCRRQASAMHVSVRAVEKGPGGNLPPIWPNVWAAGRCFTLFQHLRNAPGAVKPLHGGGRYLRLTIAQWPGSAPI